MASNEYTDFVRQPIEEYIKIIATYAAERQGGLSKIEIERAAEDEASKALRPYVLAALGIGGAGLLLGLIAFIRSDRR